MPAKFDEKLQRVHVMTPVSLLARINAWRRQQEDFPTLSETIRRLIEAGLDATSKKGKHR